MAQRKRLYDSVRDKLDYVSTKLSNAVHDFYQEGKTNALLDVLDEKTADKADERVESLDLLVASGCINKNSDWDLVTWACGKWNECKIARA